MPFVSFLVGVQHELRAWLGCLSLYSTSFVIQRLLLATCLTTLLNEVCKVAASLQAP